MAHEALEEGSEFLLDWQKLLGGTEYSGIS